jgi:hypothetical protein
LRLKGRREKEMGELKGDAFVDHVDADLRFGSLLAEKGQNRVVAHQQDRFGALLKTKECEQSINLTQKRINRRKL